MIPAAESRWRSVLHARFAGQPLPLLHADGETWTAASLWAGSRLWVTAFREAGLQPGDRLLAAVTPAPMFVQVLLAACWEGLTLAPIGALPHGQFEDLAERLDARAIVGAGDGAHAWRPTASHLPPTSVPPLRPMRHPPTPGVRLLLRTSGSAGRGRWVALSDDNLFAVLDSHAPALSLDGARVLSLLPWHHAFGLILDLLASLLAGGEIVRVADGGRDLAHLLAAAREHEVTHLNAVPLTVHRIAEQPEGGALLRGLRGGIIGGAPVHEPLATLLRSTQLRVGYGQTEAAPGICLGEPGVWRDGTIGRPLGCEVRVSEAGELAFRGVNACAGFWSAAGLESLPALRWEATGDLVRPEADGTYTFLGRASSSFKLANGRMVEAARIEAGIRDVWPDVQEVALLPRGGMALDLAVTYLPGAAANDDVLPTSVIDTLGALARLPLRLIPLLHDAWPRTPKGDTDRAALAALLNG